MSQSPSSPGAGPLTENHGWRVAFAGTGINLALGVLYTWSLFKGAIEQQFGWKGSQLNDPYALCCAVFALTMIAAGRCQDRFGPRVTASIGGLLIGVGLVLISRSDSYAMWLLGFGVLVGLGIGFGYSSATPPALKWFPPARTGLITGIVVSGFGLAPVYLAPLSQYFLGHYGLANSMLIFGIAFFVAVCGLAQLLVNPPHGYSPLRTARTPPASASTLTSKPATDAGNLSPSQILANPMFYLLWVIYFIGAGAGLMVISSMSGMAKKSMGNLAFFAVAIMAVGNASGRIMAGVLSDRIGRSRALALVLSFQAVLMFLAIPLTSAQGSSPALIVTLAALIGFNYGANLSLFPSLAKDFWGLKNFGMNYGILFTAWGAGGFALSRLQQMLTASSGGSFRSSLIVAGSLLAVGAVLSLGIRKQWKS